MVRIGSHSCFASIESGTDADQRWYINLRFGRFKQHYVRVGNALVAAREHASSFGAVETDVFLDSEKPSLFDIFSDEFGEPVREKESGESAGIVSAASEQPGCGKLQKQIAPVVLSAHIVTLRHANEN